MDSLWFNPGQNEKQRHWRGNAGVVRGVRSGVTAGSQRPASCRTGAEGVRVSRVPPPAPSLLWHRRSEEPLMFQLHFTSPPGPEELLHPALHLRRQKAVRGEASGWLASTWTPFSHLFPLQWWILTQISSARSRSSSHSDLKPLNGIIICSLMRCVEKQAAALCCRTISHQPPVLKIKVLILCVSVAAELLVEHPAAI